MTSDVTLGVTSSMILGMTSDVVSDMTWLYNEFLAVAYVTAKSRYENVQSIK